MSVRILKVNSSARYADASSRRIAEAVVADLLRQHPDAQVIERDVAQGLPVVTETLIEARYTPVAERTPAQHHVVSASKHLIDEFKSADYLVVGLPIYNFSVPASLKAYFDQIAAVDETFHYTETGPVGMVHNIRKAYLAVTSGGTSIDGQGDYASGFAAFFLNFLGVKDVQVLDGTGQAFDAEGAEARAIAQISDLVAA
ncbi:FMN-dependent NADH-azoreductase [Longispora albida]|uniref:FMN-dependent NADH-azoreductase n=1 Tax=Longispora albida TaxID=203523 RepID=UPI000379345E|nr:NAD(P)H-dependent oxidoreductase [Longispora albida]